MLWLITGGIGCGKSAFAEELALKLGREAICLSCPAFPSTTFSERAIGNAVPTDFSWTNADADHTLAAKIRAINLQSNFFRAESRILLVDSLSGWLRAAMNRTLSGEQPIEKSRLQSAWHEVLDAIFSFQGKIIVVTEETTAGLSLDSREQWFTYEIADANRRLSEASSTFYRLTAGIAAEVKGYRVKRGTLEYENIYPDRG